MGNQPTATRDGQLAHNRLARRMTPSAFSRADFAWLEPFGVGVAGV